MLLSEATQQSKTLEHISIDIIVNHKKYSINNFYRPPNNLSEDKQKFLELIDEYKKFKRENVRHFRFHSIAPSSAFGKSSFYKSTYIATEANIE